MSQWRAIRIWADWEQRNDAHTDSEDEATNLGAGVDSGVSRHLTLWLQQGLLGAYLVVIPPKVLSEIHRIAMAEHRDGRVNSSWTEVPTSRILVAWWLAFAYATVAGGISRSVIEGEGVIPRGSRVATVQTACAWSASANFVQVATAALAIVFVRQVGSRLQSDVRLGRFSQGR
ncbi:DUF4328 domain-containing protein [Candidatus Poriferisodalis sp.]|uniref:DUF4328 domain-containing protein n=1 Tax=Candidatus Poriferisodalis sp. TaxID=3101277 RepID=UPI003D13B08C